MLIMIMLIKEVLKAQVFRGGGSEGILPQKTLKISDGMVAVLVKHSYICLIVG